MKHCSGLDMVQTKNQSTRCFVVCLGYFFSRRRVFRCSTFVFIGCLSSEVSQRHTDALNGSGVVPRRTLIHGSRWVSVCRCAWSAVERCCRGERSFQTGPTESAPPGTELGRLHGRWDESIRSQYSFSSRFILMSYDKILFWYFPHSVSGDPRHFSCQLNSGSTREKPSITPKQQNPNNAFVDICRTPFESSVISDAAIGVSVYLPLILWRPPALFSVLSLSTVCLQCKQNQSCKKY